MKLTILSRSYCHLCDDLIAALNSSQRRHQIQLKIEIIDIDLYPELEIRYGDKVPVLLDGENEICHYFFDEGAFLANCTAHSSISLRK